MQRILGHNKKNNFYTILLFLVLNILPLLDAGFDNKASIYLLLITLIILLVINVINKESIKIDLTSPILWYSLYLLWCILSFIWSIYYLRTIIEFMELLLYGTVLLITTQLNDEENLKVIYVTSLIACCIALLGILEYLLISSSRITSTFTNPNPFGTYLLILFLFSWGLALNTKINSYKIFSLIFLVALLLSGSRGGYFATILSFPFLLLGSSKKEFICKILKTIILVGLSLSITAIIIYSAPYVQDKLGIKPDMLNFLIRKDSLLGSSLIGRLEFWKVAWELIKSKPIIGYGLGTFFSAYYLQYTGTNWISRFVHNHYLQIMTEMGTIGIILFLIFLYSFFYIAYNRVKSKDMSIYFIASLAGIIGFLIHIGAEFSFNFPGVTIILFWLMGINLRESKSLFDTKKSININHKSINIILLVLTIFVLYNLTFLKLIDYSTALIFNGQKDKAFETIVFVNKFYPISNYANQLEGKFYYERYQQDNSKTDLEVAINQYERVLKIAPYDGTTHNRLGNLYFEYNDIDNAEKHLVLGADYGAYVITRYMDLGLFYFKQNRVLDAEKALLKGESLIQAYIQSATREDKDSRLINAITLHKMLYELYGITGENDKLQLQLKDVKDMVKEYPFLIDYISDDLRSNL